MSRLSCVELADMASELTLGVLDGPDRAAALGHLGSCAACRQLVEELAHVADTMYALTPGADPPLGFETRVMSRLTPQGPGRRARRSRVVAALVAAVVLSSALTVAILRHADRAERRLTHEYVAALRVLGGRSLRAAVLRNAAGQPAGEIFLYDGHPSWWFIELKQRPAVPLALELDIRGGRRLHFDLPTAAADVPAWGMRAPGSLSGVVGAQLMEPTGTTQYHAEGLAAS